MKIKFLFLFLLAVVPMSVWGQGSGKIFSTDPKILFNIRNGQISDSAGAVIFTTRGNLIFRGNSMNNEDILYLVKADDIFGRDVGYVYNQDLSKIYFTFRKGKFYVSEQRFSEFLVAEMEKEKDDLIKIYDSQKKEEIAYIMGVDFSNAELIASLLAVEGYFNLEDSLDINLNAKEYAFDGKRKGLIKLASATGFYYEWEWDGRILKPRWGNRPEDEWIFDGKYLRPYWGVATREEWVWDGQFLKPYWQHIPEMEYIWDGTSIYPYWTYRENADWKISENIAKPKWSNDYRYEWEIEGNIPIPVIAIVVLGIADR